MKIAVQGKLIDTENIYSISEIENDYINSAQVFKFEIESFNSKIIEIYVSREDGFDRKIQRTPEERWSEMMKYSDINLKRITKMREDIFNLWSDNQAKIPTFDIKKY